MRADPDDLHQWVSFDDPDEDRTWVVDLTFLRSSWTCIFGCGCQGVLTEPAPELGQGCCSYGAHFIDDDDVAAVQAAVTRLRPDQWQLHRKGRKGRWLAVDDEGVRTTRVVEGACVFLNRPDFPGGAGCAFHVAAVEAGERPMDWKPDVCWQLPLRLEEHRDEHGHLTSTLREWKRRDWGEGGFEFAWWCTDEPDAFVGDHPVVETLRDEIIELVGATVYDLIAEQVARRSATPLPHPAVRRR